MSLMKSIFVNEKMGSNILALHFYR